MSSELCSEQWTFMPYLACNSNSIYPGREMALYNQAAWSNQQGSNFKMQVHESTLLMSSQDSGYDLIAPYFAADLRAL